MNAYSEWHLLRVDEVEQHYQTGPQGLTGAEAARRLAEYGPNKLEEYRKKSPLMLLLSQFADFMILVLLAAALVSGLIGDLTDALIIVGITVVNATVGFIQEFRAEKAMAALRRMASGKARVRRDNMVKEVSVEDLVPGDLVLLEAGQVIPADVRFAEVYQMHVDESALTGESHNVEKGTAPLAKGEYSLGDRHNMGYKGTSVTQGRGTAYVVATGMNTEIGRIARMVQSREPLTPLQRRLIAFGKKLSVGILIICALIFLFGWLRGEDLLTMLLTAISLAVAAIPEALPAMVTVALAMGAARLVKQNALVRKLSAVETIGSVTYICSDKTGTLTQNQMQVKRVFASPLPQEDIPADFPDLFLLTMALNNDVQTDSRGQLRGEATEEALARYAQEQGYSKRELETRFPRIEELPFDSVRKCMTTIHETTRGPVALVKGAPESILSRLDPERHQTVIERLSAESEAMAAEGFRVMAFAWKPLSRADWKVLASEAEKNLRFLGFAGLIDPSRPEVPQAIAECRRAGIIPVMITGDHKLTATAIARQIGILDSAEDIVLTGPELSQMSEEDFKSIVARVRVYARTSPEQKLRIVRALQEAGEFVAMTGDGVNDAPALKSADIGIAMGLKGTEVAREASHLVLLDDNFATIVRAVRQGRRIYDNILKFIKYTMTSNSGEIWCIFLAPFFLLPIPLQAIHILWINLVTDGLPGLALAMEPSEKNVMERPPRPPDQNFLSGSMPWHIVWVGLLMGLLTLATQALALRMENAHWQTMAFTVLCLSQMGHVLAIRSEYTSLFRLGLFSNIPLAGAFILTVILQLLVVYVPFLQPIFKTEALDVWELLLCLALSSVVFWAVELEKWIKRRRSAK